MADKIVITEGTTSPSVEDTIYIDQSVFDLTDSSVSFKMRARGTTAPLKINTSAVIVNATEGTVRYDWFSADVDTPGEYKAWWEVLLPSSRTQDTPEFTVIVDEHSEGEGVFQGEITYQARQLMPVTWDALSNDIRYGDRMLNSRVNYIKYKLFATVCDPESEITFYNPFVTDYASKEAALQLIPAGIEYWMTQQETITTTGTSEVVSYPDRIKALQDLQAWLMAEVRDIQTQLPPGTTTTRKYGRGPKVGNGDDLITPDPQRFPKEYGPFYPIDFPWGGRLF